ncbi:MAG: DUF7507 domain-containing protein, partial [Ardenticatenaceae bacterium]
VDHPVTGVIIGSESQPVSGTGPINNIGFRADVTSIVQGGFAGAGTYNFGIRDGNLSNNLNVLDGAGLLVIFEDPADFNTYRAILYEGLDFAYGDDPTPGDTRETAPVIFKYAASGDARTANLTLFVGDPTPERPDRVEISDNSDLVNQLVSADGEQWDSPTIGIDIPAGVSQTTVQLFSEPRFSNPDSLLWELGVLRIPIVVSAPAIDIEKATNGEDADSPTGPIIPVGDPVNWTYVVTNTGNVPLTNVVVTDDQGVAVSCPKDALAVGESMICTASGTAEPGQYANVGTVMGDSPDGTKVTDDDPSHYFGEEVIIGGGEGCTPGYWKQAHHFDSWVGFDPSDSFDAVFGVTSSFGSNFTLLQA